MFFDRVKSPVSVSIDPMYLMPYASAKPIMNANDYVVHTDSLGSGIQELTLLTLKYLKPVFTTQKGFYSN